MYCAVVLDAFSRRVVSCSIRNNPTAAPTSNALGMAIEQREAARGETAIHSDHGTQFTSWAFTERARQSGLVPSMGSVGDCYDNAMIEAFWSRMQGGRLGPETRLHQSRGIAQPPENSGSFKLVGEDGTVAPLPPLAVQAREQRVAAYDRIGEFRVARAHQHPPLAEAEKAPADG